MNEIQQLIEGQINLPSPPVIAVQILNTVKQADYSLEDLEKIIQADAALTGKNPPNSKFGDLCDPPEDKQRQ